MSNARNGVNPSMVPQGLMGPIMPLPLDASSAVQGASLEIPISAPLSRSTLASALASASPDNQRLVSTILASPTMTTGPFFPFNS